MEHTVKAPIAEQNGKEATSDWCRSLLRKLHELTPCLHQPTARCYLSDTLLPLLRRKQASGGSALDFHSKCLALSLVDPLGFDFYYLLLFLIDDDDDVSPGNPQAWTRQWQFIELVDPYPSPLNMEHRGLRELFIEMPLNLSRETVSTGAGCIHFNPKLYKGKGT